MSAQKSKSGASFNRLLRDYKKSAERRGIAFELSEHEFRQLTHQHCTYCGVEPKQVVKNSPKAKPYIYNGIDRRDNEVGYLPGNCVSCCRFCNELKGTLRPEHLALLISQMVAKSISETLNLNRAHHELVVDLVEHESGGAASDSPESPTKE